MKMEFNGTEFKNFSDTFTSMDRYMLGHINSRMLWALHFFFYFLSFIWEAQLEKLEESAGNNVVHHDKFGHFHNLKRISLLWHAYCLPAVVQVLQVCFFLTYNLNLSRAPNGHDALKSKVSFAKVEGIWLEETNKVFFFYHPSKKSLLSAGGSAEIKRRTTTMFSGTALFGETTGNKYHVLQDIFLSEIPLESKTMLLGHIPQKCFYVMLGFVIQMKIFLMFRTGNKYDKTDDIISKHWMSVSECRNDMTHLLLHLTKHDIEYHNYGASSGWKKVCC